MVDGKAVLDKVARRLIPFMVVLYVVAYLDRINVGFAALQMNQDLGFSAAVYGLGSGIFFLGYFLCEVPSNLVLARVGARDWIARIMISWGLVATAMAFIRDEQSFYGLRFLLGVAEAGFFPGLILYLTYWFPAEERARTTALFMTATALAGVLGGPISGALLSMHGLGGFAGWQLLFFLEGIPAILLGIAVLFYLTDRPEQARWLTPPEREWLIARLAAERAAQVGHAQSTLRQALLSGRVWLLAVLYLTLAIGLYGVALWLPQIVEGFSGAGDFAVGVITAIPYLVAGIGMVLIGRHSDRTGERRGHVAVALAVAATGLVLSALTQGLPVVAVAALALAALGVWGALGPFWALPPAFLSGTAAAGGIALINSVGNLGGFFGPSLVGFVKNATGSFSGAFLALAAIVAAGALLAALLRVDPAPPAVDPARAPASEPVPSAQPD